MTIELLDVTKDYGEKRGIFNVSLAVNKGEAVGFIGINGAGKTTTIRLIMGFLKATAGTIRVNGLDAWQDAAQTKASIGYLPGEIAFPDVETGWDFIYQQAHLLSLTDFTYAKQLVERLQLDPSANVKRMSKGMKQKTAIVVAFMARPDILILDEPTTGLDPLMRAEFVRMLQEEHARGATIFMSSHMFDEVEATCDRVVIIQEGHIVKDEALATLIGLRKQRFEVVFATEQEAKSFQSEAFDMETINATTIQLSLEPDAINDLLHILKDYAFVGFSEIPYTLQHYFYEMNVGGLQYVE